ncbi:RNA polymerase II accessory factor, Cdc73 [Kalmanozyma brasiliensis GHG001]|uniref:Putative RNA Pol II elongation accessory factor n=1 Tax=Kalmanozyma brasiliensis (strain GHG001) TaxID=1365824 RepID=V5EDK7_KALBG|nr:RNA polymerase II accessory factor, Cdc73 [Kalmanozyma brasiliensis GHG001]EST08531.1 RNA polymerase II accessory factor, Cdc73 [Kalmanozyma brasiliensis GHG001]
MAATASSSAKDALDLIREAIRSTPNPVDPLASIQLLDSQSAPVTSILQASSIKVGGATLNKSTTTRLARSRDDLASRRSSGNLPHPDAEPSFFYDVEAVILALQARDERPGAYLAQAATAKVASFPTLDRAAILDYLLGRRDDWAGVLQLADLSSAATASTGTASIATTSADASSAAEVGGVKRAYQVNARDVEYVKRVKGTYEIVLRTRNDALRGNLAGLTGGAAVSRVSSKVADFESFRRSFSAKVEAARRAAGKAPPPGSAPSASRPGVSASGQVRKQRAQDPIVVLSSSPTSLLNMFNIKQFLEEGVFVAPEEARQRARGVADLVVSITSRGGTGAQGGAAGVGIGRRILVVDSAEAVTRLGGSSASAPGSDPWNRVIAVFTTGQAWQFKTYRWTEPRELFKNVMGVYVRWHNEPQNPNVRDWNVVEVQVDRNKRHTDKQAVSHFWRQLESWTQRRKPNLIA